MTDNGAVGWDVLNKSVNPLTGDYVGSPQNQAQKSRQHLKSAHTTFHQRMV
jgi:hypothetical protein